jgi:hypothetical protein
MPTPSAMEASAANVQAAASAWHAKFKGDILVSLHRELRKQWPPAAEVHPVP